MTEPLRKLTPEEFFSRAHRPLRAIFRSFEIEALPFQDWISDKMILDIDGFFLDESEFATLSECAALAGDETLFYSICRGYLGGPEFLPYYTWELELFDYRTYYHADDVSGRQERDIGIPLERVLYSPGAKWGILFPEIVAVLGGSKEFLADFRGKYRRCDEALQVVLDELREGAEKRQADVSWVPRLLRHIYGDDAPHF
jgi:hypothetical protein